MQIINFSLKGVLSKIDIKIETMIESRINL